MPRSRWTSPSHRPLSAAMAEQKCRSREGSGRALTAGPDEAVRTSGRDGSRGRAHLKRERVGNATGASTRAATLSGPDYERLTAGRHTPEQFMDAAFRF